MIEVNDLYPTLTLSNKHRAYAGTVCSNQDHEIDAEVLRKLKEGSFYADYTAWNFHGVVWHDRGKYHCQVSVQKQKQPIISDRAFSRLKAAVCSKYGED